MKRLLGLLLAFLTVPAAAAPPQAVVDSVRERAAAHGFDGTILIGEADGSSRTLALGASPVAADAVWRWASISKQLAAVLVMQEVTRGRIDLDAPVSRYLPDWSSPNAATARVRDLLRHNSGLPQPDSSPADAQGVPAFYRSAAASPADSARGFCAGPVRAPAPAGFEYNNCDTIVLGEVLRRVTGKPYAALVSERFARPLGLRSVGLFQLGRPRAHVQPTGEFADIDPLIDLGVNGASGGLYGTIGDLWRFDHALLTGRLLPPAAREAMWSSERANGYYGFHQWSFTAPLAGCATPIRVIERQGQIGGIELRNFLLPGTNRGLILFSRKRPTNLGDPWEGRGFAFDLLSAVACRA